MRTECPELASFAIRLLKTPANSVAAERPFSAMNIILRSLEIDYQASAHIRLRTSR